MLLIQKVEHGFMGCDAGSKAPDKLQFRKGWLVQSQS